MAKSGHRSSHAMQTVHLSMSTTFTVNISIPNTFVGQSLTQISHPLQKRGMMLIFTFSFSVASIFSTASSLAIVAILSLLMDFSAQPFRQRDPQIRGGVGNRNPRLPERLDLFRRGPLPLGARLPRHEADDWLGHLRLHEGRRFFLGRSPDLADQDHRLGLRVLLEGREGG